MRPLRWPAKKTWFRLHGWVGVNFGLLLFIVCFSGTVATLSHEIDWLLNPAVRATTTGAPESWSWQSWNDAVEAAHPGAHVAALAAPPADGWAAQAMIAYGPSDVRHVYVHPGTGRVQGTVSSFNVARFFRSFHKQFYIYPGSLPHGLYAVGPMAIVLLFSAVTALCFYTIRWRDLVMRHRAASRRTLWSVLHRASGVWMLMFTLVFAVTGVWYLLERVAADAGLPISAEVLASADAVPDPGSATLDLDATIASARRAFPELEVRSIRFPRRENTAVTIYGDAEAWLVRGSANFVVADPYAARALRRQDATDLPLGTRLTQTADPLHFGTFGGLPTKLLWFTAGLIISASVLAGLRIWYLRTARHPAALQGPVPGISRGGLVTTLGVLALSTYGSIVNIGDAIVHGPGPCAQPGARAPSVECVGGIAQTADLVPFYVWVVVGAFIASTVAISMVTLAALRPRRPAPAEGRAVPHPAGSTRMEMQGARGESD